MSVVPGVPLWELGEMDIVTPAAGGGAAVACAVQLAEAFTAGSSSEVAVTVMMSIVPLVAFDGIVTLSVAFPLLPADTVSGLGGTLGDHPALSATVKE